MSKKLNQLGSKSLLQVDDSQEFTYALADDRDDEDDEEIGEPKGFVGSYLNKHK